MPTRWVRGRFDRLPRLLRFTLTGGVGAAARALLIFLLVGTVGMGERPAYVLAVAVTIALLWVLNRRLTWTDQPGSRVWFAVGRVSTEAVGWFVFVHLLGARLRVGSGVVVNYQLANLASIAVGTLCNFVTCQWLVFRDPATASRLRLKRLVLLAPLLVWSGHAEHTLGAYWHPTVLVAWSFLSLVLLMVAGLTFVRMQYGWQHPDRVDHVDLTNIAPARYQFSLILPARVEPVLACTLAQILASDYPRDLYEVLVVVSRDDCDWETRAVAEAYAGDHPNIRVLSPPAGTRSKPHSLEEARRHCHGDLVGVVDAESLLAGGLLGYVNTLATRYPDVGIFQGGVQLTNFRAGRWSRPAGSGWMEAFGHWLNTGTSWWRARNCLEYYVWFMSRLRYQARVRFIPLGGNTVFIRRDVLDRVGGWDISCLTEDCDLGVRASVHRIRTMVFYEPALTTREETPESLTKLVVQRSRWMAGFMHVLLKGDWRRQPGIRQRLLAGEMLVMPFFQAIAGSVIPVSIVVALLLRAPVGLVIWLWLPGGMNIMMIAAEQVAFREFTRAYQLQANWLDNARLVICSPLYQFALSVAAVRATVRLLRGQVEWEKTAHSGAHYSAAAGSAGTGVPTGLAWISTQACSANT